MKTRRILPWLPWLQKQDTQQTSREPKTGIAPNFRTALFATISPVYELLEHRKFSTMQKQQRILVIRRYNIALTVISNKANVFCNFLCLRYCLSDVYIRWLITQCHGNVRQSATTVLENETFKPYHLEPDQPCRFLKEYWPELYLTFYSSYIWVSEWFLLVLRFGLDGGLPLEPRNPLSILRVILAEKVNHFEGFFLKMDPCFRDFLWKMGPMFRDFL